MNNPVIPATNTPANPGNPYIAYGMTGARDGLLLKFTKEGEWSAGLGDDATTLPAGTQLLAAMPYLALAWTKWLNSKPVDRRVTLVSTGQLPPRRDELGDTDQALWELSGEGSLRDPWQATHELPLTSPETGEQYLYSTSSVGGIAALSRLSTAYGRSMVRYPRHNPIVALGAGGYQHKIASRGWINTPSLRIVGWQPREDGDEPAKPALRDLMADELPF